MRLLTFSPSMTAEALSYHVLRHFPGHARRPYMVIPHLYPLLSDVYPGLEAVRSGEVYIA